MGKRLRSEGMCLGVVCAAKPATSLKPSVAINGYVTMRTNTSFFHMPEIAAIEITVGIPFAAITTMRNTPATMSADGFKVPGTFLIDYQNGI